MRGCRERQGDGNITEFTKEQEESRFPTLPVHEGPATLRIPDRFLEKSETGLQACGVEVEDTGMWKSREETSDTLLRAGAQARMTRTGKGTTTCGIKFLAVNISEGSFCDM